MWHAWLDPFVSMELLLLVLEQASLLLAHLPARPVLLDLIVSVEFSIHVLEPRTH